MSFYNLGLRTGTALELPEQVTCHETYGRVQDGWGGLRAVVRNGSSFYSRGVAGRKPVVGATTPLGKATEGLIGLILDIAHVLLILAGMYTLWGALRP